jgi:molybdopterin-binding protein
VALSGGERKRVALGRALIAEPELLLLDEPDAHLDRASRRVIESLLRGLPGTLVFTTHDLRFAHRLADEFLHLRDGRVVAGMPENVFAGCVLPMTEDPGISRIETSGGIVLRAQGRFAPGPARVAIDPRHLVVSREPLASSMLNHFTGRVTSAHEDDRGIWLEAALGGEQLTAVISRSSYERLGLNLGCAVVVSCKVSAVEVLWPGAPDGNGGPPGGDVDG